MPYRSMGWIHANVARWWQDSRGQGTVEYVGLMLLLATLLAGVVGVAAGLNGGGLAEEIVKKVKGAINKVGEIGGGGGGGGGSAGSAAGGG